MFEKDCFAYTGRKKFCTALNSNVKNCVDCKFYRNDITNYEIENKISTYYLKKEGK